MRAHSAAVDTVAMFIASAAVDAQQVEYVKRAEAVDRFRLVHARTRRRSHASPVSPLIGHIAGVCTLMCAAMQSQRPPRFCQMSV